MADQTATPLASTSTAQPERRRARCQNSLTWDMDISETVRWRVAQRLRQVPMVDAATFYNKKEETLKIRYGQVRCYYGDKSHNLAP